MMSEREEEKKKLPFCYTYIASPQQDDLMLSGPPPDECAGGEARSRVKIVPTDLRADSLSTVPPKFRKSPQGSIPHPVSART
ncbi:hypothetical protein PoB_004789500 [Plakobranchus ocellatus]|uniref:Uncharacterized protein n=1 Tax=Plakobranchus ocellatus TaxID=259542 RepID=A0AAV4BQL0_9GAST|nr:hypothetical protein PoB_004789500 [Plakobranchus ocellatus]